MIIKLAEILLDLNEKLYNLPSHLVILFLWVSTFFFDLPAFHLWFGIGLVVWGAMFVYRMKHDNFSTNELKEAWKKSGVLGFLVGLNVCVVLSLASFPVLVILAYANKWAKSDKD